MLVLITLPDTKHLQSGEEWGEPVLAAAVPSAVIRKAWGLGVPRALSRFSRATRSLEMLSLRSRGSSRECMANGEGGVEAALVSGGPGDQ